jgi:hypothetical protein
MTSKLSNPRVAKKVHAARIEADAEDDSSKDLTLVTPTFVNMLCMLEPGECASKVKPLILGDSMGNQFADFAGKRQQFRNAITPSRVQAQRKLASLGTTASFSIEVSETITPGGRVYLVAIVTRVK